MIISREKVQDKISEANKSTYTYNLILFKTDNVYAFGFENADNDFSVNRCGTLQEVREALKRWINSDYRSRTEKTAANSFLTLLKGA